MAREELYFVALSLLFATSTGLGGILISIIGYFLKTLHDRFEAHLKEAEVESKTVGERLTRVEETTKNTKESCDRIEDILREDRSEHTGKFNLILEALRARA